MIKAIDTVGLNLILLARAIEDFIELVARLVPAVFTPPFRVKDVINQLYFVANQSAPIIVFCVSFAAIVTIIEAAFHMKMVVHNVSMVPGFAALLILRELGVVIAALLVTSRVGAGIAAEVGTMQITEQVDALKMLGIDPIRFLVVPRFIACVIGGIILTVFSNTVCILGAMWATNLKLGFTSGEFIMHMNRFVQFKDVLFAMIKGGVFGAVIPVISCYYGFRCKAGAEGVGLATTNSVVTSSVAIIFLDFVLTYILSHFY
jgi:phospholipid/cholesterol/gamma-HCH transport system permease protein